VIEVFFKEGYVVSKYGENEGYIYRSLISILVKEQYNTMITYNIKYRVLLTSAPVALVKELKIERKENVCIEKTKI
jgi:hypothetical protein